MQRTNTEYTKNRWFSKSTKDTFHKSHLFEKNFFGINAVWIGFHSALKWKINRNGLRTSLYVLWLKLKTVNIIFDSDDNLTFLAKAFNLPTRVRFPLPKIRNAYSRNNIPTLRSKESELLRHANCVIFIQVLIFHCVNFSFRPAWHNVKKPLTELEFDHLVLI